MRTERCSPNLIQNTHPTRLAQSLQPTKGPARSNPTPALATLSLVHVPNYLQVGAPAVEPLDCATYDEPTYEEECPPPGIELCGGPMGISPGDGSSIRRPYRKMRKKCTFGCECADGPEVETYESCAVADSDYRYTNRPCAPVYKIDSEDTTQMLQGMALTWAPLAGGESYSVVDAQPGSPLDEKCMGLKSNLFEVRGTDYFYTFSTTKVPTALH